MTSTLIRYDALVTAGELRADKEQRWAAQRLERLQQELEAAPQKGSVLWRMLGRKPDAPRGVYLWGGVGRGKTMLMDLFHDSLKIAEKRRVHFHAFMQEIHKGMHDARKKGVEDPLAPVADAIIAGTRLLAAAISLA